MDVRKPRVVAILQARMGSTRLPGKVLNKVLDRPLLLYEIERLRRSHLIDEIVVATTTSQLDKQIVRFCEESHFPVFCGSEEDVLDRYYRAAKAFKADVVIRVTGDCPIIDPEVVDQVIAFYLEASPPFDYVSNTLQRTYPRGLDIEVFSFKGLERAAHETKLPYEREHVTPYFYQHPELFRLGNVACETDESRHRWTVDTAEDFELISRLLGELYPNNPEFRMADVLQVLKDHPDWVKINAHIEQKPM